MEGDYKGLKEAASKNFLNIWNEFTPIQSNVDIDKIIEQIKIYEQIQSDDQRAIVLFSSKDFKIHYWGGNFEGLFGYKRKDYNLWNVQLYFKAIVWEHIDFPLKVIRWGKKVDQLYPNSELKHKESYYCGLKLRSKTGRIVKIFLRQTFIAFEKNRHFLSLVFIEDVQHLMKADFYWCIHRNTKSSIPSSHFFRSKGAKKEYSDIITKREKEVLQLISTGKNTKEIAEILHLSAATVETHRKNMLARSGAKDTTALIHLCRLCKAI